MRSRFRPDDLDLIDAHIIHCERRNLSTKTIHQRVNRIAQLADRYPDRPLLDLGAEDIEQMMDSIRGQDGKGMKATTRKAFASVVRTFYAWAMDYGYTDSNPMTRVVTPRVSLSAPHPISEEHYSQAIQAAPTPQMRLWLLLGGAMGLRVAEIAGLRWEDVDLDGTVMRVTGKGDKTRSLPIPELVVESLIEHRDKTGGERWSLSTARSDARTRPPLCLATWGSISASTAGSTRHILSATASVPRLASRPATFGPCRS